MNLADESPKNSPPLGQPVGSVRALLTLFIIAVVTMSVAKGRDLYILWIETLLISLAQYFTSRRFIDLPPRPADRTQVPETTASV